VLFVIGGGRFQRHRGLALRCPFPANQGKWTLPVLSTIALGNRHLLSQHRDDQTRQHRASFQNFFGCLPNSRGRRVQVRSKRQRQEHNVAILQRQVHFSGLKGRGAGTFFFFFFFSFSFFCVFFFFAFFSLFFFWWAKVGENLLPPAWIALASDAALQSSDVAGTGIASHFFTKCLSLRPLRRTAATTGKFLRSCLPRQHGQIVPFFDLVGRLPEIGSPLPFTLKQGGVPPIRTSIFAHRLVIGRAADRNVAG